MLVSTFIESVEIAPLQENSVISAPLQVFYTDESDSLDVLE